MKRYYLITVLFITLLSINLQAQDDLQYRKLLQTLKFITEDYVDIVDTTAIVDKAINTMLKELDPHSVYIKAKRVKAANEPLKGNFEGIGIEFNILRDTVGVVHAISGGPSEKLGIRAGDKIIFVEGENFTGETISNTKVINTLRGKKDTKVEVGILRKGEKKVLYFTITRDKIPIYSVDASHMVAPGIGYIKVNRFAATTMHEFQQAITELKTKNLESLILDLRGNTGGYLGTAIGLADEFLQNGKLIVYTKGRKRYDNEQYKATSRGNFETGKLVVLIDEGSASASEIVSGAIQDWDRGIVMGRRSFGKGLVQKPFRLADGGMIRLTIARYYTPSGRCIQKPYDKGLAAYRKDIVERYNKGEFINQDSIKLPDSLKYETLINKRTVYGGGGIMPDIFIPLDTSNTTDYYSKIIRKGIFNDFISNYIDKKRKKLILTYKDIETFNTNFKVDEKLTNELMDFATKKGIEKDEKELDKSIDLINKLLKALIARSLWNTNGYYEVINKYEPTVLEAIKAIKQDKFKTLNIK